MPITGGPSTPTMPLRVTTDRSTPRLVKASTGISTIAQLARTSPRLRPGETSVPVRPTRRWVPTPITPARRLLAASSTTRPTAQVAAARTLPANTSDRLAERPSSVFQVPWRSSEAKMSPATRPVSTGSPHEPANPSATSGTAKPEVWTQRPNSVSAGTALWLLTTATNTIGASRQRTPSALSGSWEASFASSARQTLPTPGQRAWRTGTAPVTWSAVPDAITPPAGRARAGAQLA